MDKAALVDAVKNLQRSDPAIKEAWWALCESDLGGVKDPNRHEESVLENFLSMYGEGGAAPAPVRQRPAPRAARPAAMVPMAPQFGGGGFGGGFGGKGMVGPGRFGGGMAMGGGMTMGGGMAMGGGPPDMVSWIKMGQKTSGAFKAGWQTYCSMYGGGINDPSRHDPSYMAEFINYLGQLAQADLGAAAAQAGFPMGMQMQQQQQHMGGMGGGQRRPMSGGEPPRKRQASAPMGGGDPEKAALVDRVKQLQRRDESTKAAWWAFTDEQHGGVHDPNRHESEVLTEFLSQHE